MRRQLRRLAVLIFLSASAAGASAQVDTKTRQLVQVGWDQSISRTGMGYLFYYLNRPEVYYKDMALRLVVAPVYADGELALKRIAPQTDLGIGLAGGGFAYGHNEIRRGAAVKEESFEGHGLSIAIAVYRVLNPGRMIPLQAYLRGASSVQTYQARGSTDRNFVIPLDVFEHSARLGLRFGGREPQLGRNALELSAWYMAKVRNREVQYGYADRSLRHDSHFIWGTGHFAYTFPDTGRYLSATATLATSGNADRLNAWRLGGALPLASEFPLSLPGYAHQEITARSVAHLETRGLVPLDRDRHVGVGVWGAMSTVDYLPGFEQDGSLNSGVGAWSQVDIPRWKARVGFQYGYGVQAIRGGGERGAHSVGMTVQVNIGAPEWRMPFEPAAPADRPRGYGTIRGDRILPGNIIR